MGDFDWDEHKNVLVKTEEYEERQKCRLGIDPKAYHETGETRMNGIDDTNEYHKDTFSGAGPEVKASSEDDISTILSRLQFDDQDKLSRKHRETEIKPVGEQEGRLESSQGGQADGGKDEEKSIHGVAELQSPRKDGQGSNTTVDQPKSLARLFLD